jgi:hypothetical protein
MKRNQNLDGSSMQNHALHGAEQTSHVYCQVNRLYRELFGRKELGLNSVFFLKFVL